MRMNSQKMNDGLGLMAKSGRKNHLITLEVKGWAAVLQG